MPAQAGLGLAEAQGGRRAEQGHAAGQGAQGERLPGLPARGGRGHPGQPHVHGPECHTADEQQRQTPVLQGLASPAVLAVAAFTGNSSTPHTPLDSHGLLIEGNVEYCV